MSYVPRTWSALGLAAAVVSALFLAFSGAPVVGFFPGEGLVPAAVVAVGALVAGTGLLRANPGWALAGVGILLVGTALVRIGLPGVVEWSAALAGAAGLVLFLEPLLVADRADRLRQRLAEAGDAGDADHDALARRTVDLRMRQVRRTLALAVGLVALGLLAGALLGGLLPEALAASVELDSLYGAVLWVSLAVAGLAAASAVRARRSEADDA